MAQATNNRTQGHLCGRQQRRLEAPNGAGGDARWTISQSVRLVQRRRRWSAQSDGKWKGARVPAATRALTGFKACAHTDACTTHACAEAHDLSARIHPYTRVHTHIQTLVYGKAHTRARTQMQTCMHACVRLSAETRHDSRC
jgi:hypothetical protein